MLGRRRRSLPVVGCWVTGLTLALAGCGTGTPVGASPSATTRQAPPGPVARPSEPSPSPSSPGASPAPSPTQPESTPVPSQPGPDAGTPPSGANQLSRFVGTWSGHTRTLTIDADGVGTETVYNGCCQLAWKLRFRVDHAHGTHANGKIYATLLSATFKDNPPETSNPEPKPGLGAIIGVEDGVWNDAFTGATFCDPDADAAGKCGA